MVKTVDYYESNRIWRGPVDIEKAREAILNMINGKRRSCIPVQPDDDDILLYRALNELEQYREKEEGENKLMTDHRKEDLDEIQRKMNDLMQKIESDADENLLNYLAERAELLFTGFTILKTTKEDTYKVSIDKYSAENGYEQELMIYESYDYQEAEGVMLDLCEALHIDSAWVDVDGNVSI